MSKCWRNTLLFVCIFLNIAIVSVTECAINLLSLWKSRKQSECNNFLFSLFQSEEEVVWKSRKKLNYMNVVIFLYFALLNDSLCRTIFAIVNKKTHVRIITVKQMPRFLHLAGFFPRAPFFVHFENTNTPASDAKTQKIYIYIYMKRSLKWLFNKLLSKLRADEYFRPRWIGQI